MLNLCPIPGGEYPIGDNAYPVSCPVHQVTLAAFNIGKTAVTNAEFLLFITAGGYTTRAFWSEMGLRWLKSKNVSEPAYWQDPNFNHPQQPVVGISWYEAQAYSQWLSKHTGESWRLVSEVEWEAAARGTAGHGLPPAIQINSMERGSTKTWEASKGNISWCGAVNLCGNVWEWTSSRWGRNWQVVDYTYPYDATDGRENPVGSHARVMRGGSWFDRISEAHPANRGRFLPGSRASNIGFRLAKS